LHSDIPHTGAYLYCMAGHNRFYLIPSANKEDFFYYLEKNNLTPSKENEHNPVFTDEKIIYTALTQYGLLQVGLF
jgi:hypothetical protein